MTRRHTGLQGSTSQEAAGGTALRERNAVFDSPPGPPLIETLLTVDIEQAVHLAQRMRNLEAVCRSYSGTLGDEVESIRAQMARMFGL